MNSYWRRRRRQEGKRTLEIQVLENLNLTRLRNLAAFYRMPEARSNSPRILRGLIMYQWMKEKFERKMKRDAKKTRSTRSKKRS